jgi:hypothetical protein
MIFYHGTTKKNWKKIQEEDVLWGYSIYNDENGKSYQSRRYTYLTPDLEVAEKFGDGIILEIEYEPVGVDGTVTDNYGFDPPPGEHCWQFSVFVPISLEKVKRIK